ncbi:hypothetical protein [Niallia sp. Krafla_26]|uniref:hypothetical protein n=1 Tax=Niallia sp. Krafla_26 TaxID=3064703 RepID=UPI003D164818
MTSFKYDSRIHYFEITLDNLESYAVNIEEFLNDKYEEAVSNKGGHVKPIAQYGVEFPNIMRTSLFYSCFAYLENYLLIICKEIRRFKKIEIEINDIRHKGIEKAQVYLKKIAGLKFPDQSSEWNHIKKCNKVRNILIHNGGIIENNNKNVIKEIETLNSVFIVNNFNRNEINLTASFCFEFINSVREVLRKVYEELILIINPIGKYQLMINKLMKDVTDNT